MSENQIKIMKPKLSEIWKTLPPSDFKISEIATKNGVSRYHAKEKITELVKLDLVKKTDRPLRFAQNLNCQNPAGIACAADWSQNLEA